MKALILNTFQKEWRSRSLMILIGLTLFFLFASTALLDFIINTFLANNEVLGSGKTSFTVFLGLVGLWSTFVVALIGAGIVRDDFDYQVMPQLLSLPIPRTSYLLARFIGTWTLLFSYFLVTYALAATLFQIVSGESVWHFGVALAALTYAVKIVPILLFSCLFSLYLPKLFSFVFTLILMAIVSIMNSPFVDQSYSEYLQSPSLYRYSAVVVDLIFPRMGFWANTTDLLLSGQMSEIVGFSFFAQLGHFLLTVGLWAFVLDFLFKTKEV